MPGRDRTGPMGRGPASGRGMGPCGEGGGYGYGGGFGRGRGRGRGMGFGGGYGGFRGFWGRWLGDSDADSEREMLERQRRAIDERLGELGQQDED